MICRLERAGDPRTLSSRVDPGYTGFRAESGERGGFCRVTTLGFALYILTHVYGQMGRVVLVRGYNGV